MSITIINTIANNNGGDGLRIEGDLDVHIENFAAKDNKGQGINLISAQQGLDEDTKKLILELKEALEKDDKPVIKTILAAIADKGTDFVIALIAGKFFS